MRLDMRLDMRKGIALGTGGAAVVVALVGGGVAVAGGLEPGEDHSQDYTRQQADRATAAALDATGGGTANGTLLELWTCNGQSNQKWQRG